MVPRELDGLEVGAHPRAGDEALDEDRPEPDRAYPLRSALDS